MYQARFDTNFQVETPESIDLQAQVAGPVPRILAYTIDFAWRCLAMIILIIIASFSGEAGIGLLLIAWFLIEWFYPVVYEVLRQGQTPGKKSMGIAVVNDNLTPISWGASLTRNLLRAADFLPSFYLFGMISMCISGKFQRLGDLAAGTLVVHKRDISDALTLPECTPRPSPIPLEVEDQVALVGFTQRHSQLSKDRQQELAEILQDISGIPKQNTVSYLHGIGCWLLGDRK